MPDIQEAWKIAWKIALHEVTAHPACGDTYY